jgi:hypothetical protein
MELLVSHLDVVSLTFPVVNVVLRLFRQIHFNGLWLTTTNQRFSNADDCPKGLLVMVLVL